VLVGLARLLWADVVKWFTVCQRLLEVDSATAGGDFPGFCLPVTDGNRCWLHVGMVGSSTQLTIDSRVANTTLTTTAALCVS
jgi:hypothetical protein